MTEIRQQKEEILQSNHIHSYSAYLNVKSEPKEKFLKRLLKNEFYSYDEIKDEIRRLELKLNDSPFRVMVFFPFRGKKTGNKRMSSSRSII